MMYKLKKTYFKDDDSNVIELIYIASQVHDKVADYKIVSSSMRTLTEADELPVEVKKELESKEEVRYKYSLDEKTATNLVDTYGEELYKVNTEKLDKIEE